MNYFTVKLKDGREKSLFYRHPWIFSGAIQKIGNIEDGALINVVAADGRFLARGYYNSRSTIAIRVLTFEENEMIDQSFFEKKLLAALELRKKFINERETNAYRLVFAEGDGLPGLIVDKYADVLVVQIHTLGMEKMREIMVSALVKIFAPRLIIERSDVTVRRQEGLNTMPVGVLYGTFDSGLIEIIEHGLKFLVDVMHGQKTGFFLDQRENRAAVMKYVKEKRVLNLFAYSGGFSCYALRGGASRVTSLDISKDALKLCQQNVELNSFVDESGATQRHDVVAEDVFQYLEKIATGAEKFDVVIVDPPAFVKSAKSLQNALKAYARLNEMALRVVEENGILVSSSCSSHVSSEMFKKTLFQAALRTKDDLVIVEQRTQPVDHPNKLYFPEGEYLKFFVLQKRNSASYL